MSLFNWFSAKSRTSPAPAADDNRRAAVGASRAAPSPAQDADGPDGSGRSQRHARREQLYVAIREAMTRAGVLSASYKFKVLSLDTRGKEFLVMMDLARDSGVPPEQLGEVEVLIIHHARVRYEITVAGVYWRMDDASAMGQPLPPASATAPPLVPPPEPAGRPPARPSSSAAAVRYDPIQAEELAAFRQALNAASNEGGASHASQVPRTGKARGREPSYALLTGFEDTELAPSAPVPVLSATQYGDL